LPNQQRADEHARTDHFGAPDREQRYRSGWRDHCARRLIQNTNDTTKNGIPLLSDIPVIGSAFGSTDHHVQRTELLVLLSPKIIHNSADARAATEELRSRLHALEVPRP
jgi:hypothetical protein